jgi:molybdate transport system ATP-binding protein
LFGPSGSGKSTILRAIAGLAHPQQAKIILHRGGRPQIAADTAARINLPPHMRNVRWAAQRPALFPHMTVRENLGFASPVPGLDGVQIVDDVIQQFHLGPLTGRLPPTLSGGEQHRVALARAAIGATGRLLLLDEPFTGLDATLRNELLASLRGWLAPYPTPILSVTHDIAEAFQLNAEVLKLHEGRITHQGPAAEVLAEERTRLLNQLS